MKSVTLADTSLGILSRDGVVFAAQKKVFSKLSDQTRSEKLCKIDNHIVCAVSGLTSDANSLIDGSRAFCQRWLYQYDEPAPVEALVEHIANHKQSYTQYGGLRPYGVSFLFGGWDRHKGFQLYQTDPSGNYSAWVATAIGNAAAEVGSSLKQSISDVTMQVSLEDAKHLAISSLAKTADVASSSAEKIEVLTLTKDGDSIVIMYASDEEINGICKKLAEDDSK